MVQRDPQKFIEFFRCSFWKPSALLPQRGGGVDMEEPVQLKPNNTYSLKILKPKMLGILHILYPKLWVTNFHRKMGQHKQFPV